MACFVRKGTVGRARWSEQPLLCARARRGGRPMWSRVPGPVDRAPRRPGCALATAQRPTPPFLRTSEGPTRSGIHPWTRSSTKAMARASHCSVCTSRRPVPLASPPCGTHAVQSAAGTHTLCPGPVPHPPRRRSSLPCCVVPLDRPNRARTPHTKRVAQQHTTPEVRATVRVLVAGDATLLWPGLVPNLPCC